MTNEDWDFLPEQEQERILKYLKLIKRSQTVELPEKYKRWVIENCDCDTSIVPNSVTDEHNLWL